MTMTTTMIDRWMIVVIGNYASMVTRRVTPHFHDVPRSAHMDERRGMTDDR